MSTCYANGWIPSVILMKETSRRPLSRWPANRGPVPSRSLRSPNSCVAPRAHRGHYFSVIAGSLFANYSVDKNPNTNLMHTIHSTHHYVSASRILQTSWETKSTLSCSLTIFATVIIAFFLVNKHPSKCWYH